MAEGRTLYYLLLATILLGWVLVWRMRAPPAPAYWETPLIAPRPPVRPLVDWRGVRGPDGVQGRDGVTGPPARIVPTGEPARVVPTQWR